LAHCGGCHAKRDALGGVAIANQWQGGYVEDGRWYAPSLQDANAASVHDWSVESIVEFLSSGRTARAVASGPMAEVVFRSTQHLSAEDLFAMATFLQSLPQDTEARAPVHLPRDIATMQLAEKLYRTHCEDCHGAEGQGAVEAYPALAANRGVTSKRFTNVIAAIVHGGFGPATLRNPRPYGMPPFAQKLNQREIAAVATYIRASWGNDASPISEMEIQSYMHGTLH
jgi:mono/diheme cytochrome c family protein